MSADTAVLPPSVYGFLQNRFSLFPFHVSSLFSPFFVQLLFFFPLTLPFLSFGYPWGLFYGDDVGMDTAVEDTE